MPNNTTVLTNDKNYQDIATAIRSKNGQTTLYKPGEMAAAINALAVSGQTISLQDKIVTPSGTTQTITASIGYTGLGTVTVNPVPATTATFTTNGIHNAPTGSWYSSVTVSVPVGSAINNQDISVTPTESVQTITASNGYTGIGTVTVGAISSTYIGSGITKNPTLTVSGAVVTVPTGYYSTTTSKSVNTATVGTISVNIDESGLITATATATAGYFAGGTKTATKQLQTHDDVTIIPSEEDQVLSTLGKYMLGDITIEAIETESATAVSNGTVYPSEGKYLTQVTVAVPSDINNQNKEITPTESAQTVSADVGYSGLGTVTVKAISQTYVGSAITKNPTATVNGKTVTVPVGYYNTQQTITIGSEYIVPTGTTTITSNGTYNVTTYASANINIPSDIHNQAKSVTPTESIQTISADSGYSGLSTVTVGAISSTYIGSDIATYSGMQGINNSTWTYSSNATYPYINHSYTVSEGYFFGGSKGNTFILSNVTNLPTRTATTIMPNANAQTAVGKWHWTTGDVTVAAVPTDTSNIFSANGTYTPASGKWFDSVTVSVPSGVNNQAKTATPTVSTQTITPDSNYSGLSQVTINPIPSQYITTDDATATASDIVSGKTAYVNGELITGNITDLYWDGSFIDPSLINVYDGADDAIYGSLLADYYIVMGGNGTTALYTSEGRIKLPLNKSFVGNAVPSQVLNGVTFASANGINLVGTMSNNGALGTTITTQGGTYTIPSGYTSGGTVTASLPVSTITNGVLNVATITEATNNYGVQASITIPAGYYNTTTLSRVLSDLLPIPTQAITQSQMLSGYEAYDYQGNLMVGTMTNRAAWNATLDQTTTSVTIPEGYHNGTGTVSHATVDIPNPTFSMNNSTGVITASNTWTRGFTTDNSYSNTYSLTTQAGKTVTPTESAQTAVASYRWTTGTITVAAIPSDYVGSGITTRTSLNMSANTVTALAGYYPNAVTATVTAMALPTSAVTTSSGTTKATITRSTATRYINIPVGYNSAAAHYVISAVANGTVVPPTTITGSQATVTAGTNVLTFSKSISVTPNVTTAGYISAGTASNVTVTLSAAVTTKAGATITPGTTNQTIAGGTYLTGTQTIAGDADLVAGNIKSGVNIFGVAGTYAGLDTSDATAIAGDIVLGETAYVDGEKITGTLVVQDYYTGTTAPSNSLGQNGDIYLRGGLL